MQNSSFHPLPENENTLLEGLTTKLKEEMPVIVQLLLSNLETQKNIKQNPSHYLLGMKQSPNYFIQEENSEFFKILKALQNHPRLSKNEEKYLFHSFWDTFIQQASAIAIDLRTQLNIKTKIEGIDEVFTVLFENNETKSTYYPILNELVEDCLKASSYSDLNEEDAFLLFFQSCERKGIIFDEQTKQKICHDQGRPLFETFRNNLECLLEVKIEIQTSSQGKKQCLVKGGFVCITKALLQNIQNELEKHNILHQDIDNFIFTSSHHMGIDTSLSKEEFSGAHVILHANEEIYVCRDLQIDLSGKDGEKGIDGQAGSRGIDGIKPQKPSNPGQDGLQGHKGEDGQDGAPGQVGQDGCAGGLCYIKAKKLNMNSQGGRQLKVLANGGDGGQGGHGGVGGDGGKGGDGGDGSDGLNASNGQSSKKIKESTFQDDGKTYYMEEYAGYQAPNIATLGGKGGEKGHGGNAGLGGQGGQGGQAGKKGSIILENQLAIFDNGQFISLKNKEDFQTTKSGENGEQGHHGYPGIPGSYGDNKGSPGQNGTGKISCNPIEIPNLYWVENNNFRCPRYSLSGWNSHLAGHTHEDRIQVELDNLKTSFALQKYKLVPGSEIRDKQKTTAWFTDIYSPLISVYEPCENPIIISQRDEQGEEENLEQEQQTHSQVNAEHPAIQSQETIEVAGESTNIDDVSQYFAQKQNVMEEFKSLMSECEQSSENLEQHCHFWEKLVSDFSDASIQQSMLRECIQNDLNANHPQQMISSMRKENEAITLLTNGLESLSNMTMVYQLMNQLLKSTGTVDQNNEVFTQMLAIVLEQGTEADLHQLQGLAQKHQISEHVKQEIKMELAKIAQTDTQEIANLSGQKHFNASDEIIAPAYFEDQELNDIAEELINYDKMQIKFNSQNFDEEEYSEIFPFEKFDQFEFFNDGISSLQNFGFQQSEIREKILPALHLLYDSEKDEAFFMVLDAIQKLEKNSLSQERKDHICKNIQLFCMAWSSFSYEEETLDKFEQIPIGVWDMPLKLDYRKRLLQSKDFKIFTLENLNRPSLEDEALAKERNDLLDSFDKETQDDDDHHLQLSDITTDSAEFLNTLYLFDGLLREFEEQGGSIQELEQLSNDLLFFMGNASNVKDVIQTLSFLNRHGISQIFADKTLWGQINHLADHQKCVAWQEDIQKKIFPEEKVKLSFDQLCEKLKTDESTKGKLLQDFNNICLLKNNQDLNYPADKKDKEAFIQKLKNHLENKDYAEVAVMMMNASNHSCGKYPYDSQILALLQFIYAMESGKGLAGEIATGEGKSLITNMVVACQALMGKKVMVLTSSPSLAIRDANEANQLFECLGLRASNNCDNEAISNPNQLKKRYHDNQIIFGQASDFERDQLMTEARGADICKDWNPENACLFIDEIDKTVINDGAFTLYFSDDVPDFQLLTPLIKDIWGEYCIKFKDIQNIEEGYDTESHIQQIKDQLLMVFQEKLSNNQYRLTKKLNSYVKRNLSIWINSAHQALMMNENAQYLLEPSKTHPGYTNVVVMDVSSGVEQNSTQWSDMLHQFIQLKHQLNMTPPTIMTVYESTMSFVQKFQGKIYGMTGTLGSLLSKQWLCDLCKLDYFQLPRLHQSRLKKQEETIVTDKSEWIDAIAQSVQNKKDKQPILIVVPHAGLVKELTEELTKKGITVNQSIDTNKKMIESEEKLKNVVAGDVFITTYIAGRGTDIQFDEKQLPKSGLHVILGAIPESLRAFLQVLGRGGRNGSEGSFEQIIIDEELTPLSILDYKRDFEEACTNDRIRTEDYEKNQLFQKLYYKFLEFQKDIHQDSDFQQLPEPLQDVLWQEMKMRWGLYLSSVTSAYNDNEAFTGLDKEALFLEKADKKLAKIKSTIKEEPAKEKNYRFFSTYMHLGHDALNQGNFDLAKEMFKQAAEQKTHASSFALYYQAISILGMGGEIDDITRIAAKKTLKEASQSLKLQEKSMEDAQEILNVVNECMSFSTSQRQPEGNTILSNGNLQSTYQIQSLKYLSSQLQQLIGHSFTFEEVHDFLVHFHKEDQTEEQTQILLQNLVDNQTIKNTRLSKKIEMRGTTQLELFYQDKKIYLTELSDGDNQEVLRFIQQKLDSPNDRNITKEMLRPFIRDTQESICHALEEQESVFQDRYYQLIMLDFSLDEFKKYENIENLKNNLINLKQTEYVFNQAYLKNLLNLNDVDAQSLIDILVKNGQARTCLKVKDAQFIEQIKRHHVEQHPNYILENFDLDQDLEGDIHVLQKHLTQEYFIFQDDCDEAVFDAFKHEESISKENYYYIVSADLSFDDSLQQYQALKPLLLELQNSKAFLTIEELGKAIKKENMTDEIDVETVLEHLVEFGLIKVGARLTNLEMIDKIRKKSFLIEDVAIPTSSLKTNIFVQNDLNETEDETNYYLFKDTLGLPENENAGLNQLWTQLNKACVIKNFALNRKDGIDEIDKRIESSGDLKEFLKGTRGKLFEFKDFKINKSRPDDVMYNDGISQSNTELAQLFHLGFSSIYTLEKSREQPGAAMWAMLLGFGQIIVGSILMAFLSATGIGVVAGVMLARTLISEGCSDIIMGTSGLISGNFSWKDYKAQKIESLIISGITMGAGAACKGISVLHRHRKAKKLHTQVKQMKAAARATRNVKEAKSILKQAKQLKSKGNHSYIKAQQGKTRLAHNPTNLNGMTSIKDKCRHISTYAFKKSVSSSVKGMINLGFQQFMDSLIKSLEKKILDDAKQNIDIDIHAIENIEIKELFGQLYDILSEERRNAVLENFFKSRVGGFISSSSLDGGLIDKTLSGLSDFSDIHHHSGGRLATVKKINRIASNMSKLMNTIKFAESYQSIPKKIKEELTHLLIGEKVEKQQEKTQDLQTQGIESKDPIKEKFINQALSQYQAFVSLEIFSSFEKHMIRPYLKKHVDKFSKKIISKMKNKLEYMRHENRLDGLSDGSKKMGNLEMSCILRKEQALTNSLNIQGVAIINKINGTLVENTDYMKEHGMLNKNYEVGICIHDEHAVPCVKIGNKWVIIELPQTLKNSCIPQSLCFLSNYIKAKDSNCSLEDQIKIAKQHATDAIILNNFKQEMISSLRNDNAYREGFENRDFRRYRDVAKAGSNEKRKYFLENGQNEQKSKNSRKRRKMMHNSNVFLSSINHTRSHLKSRVIDFLQLTNELISIHKRGSIQFNVHAAYTQDNQGNSRLHAAHTSGLSIELLGNHPKLGEYQTFLNQMTARTRLNYASHNQGYERIIDECQKEFLRNLNLNTNPMQMTHRYFYENYLKPLNNQLKNKKYENSEQESARKEVQDIFSEIIDDLEKNADYQKMRDKPADDYHHLAKWMYKPENSSFTDVKTSTENSHSESFRMK